MNGTTENTEAIEIAAETMHGDLMALVLDEIEARYGARGPALATERRGK